MMKTLTQCLRIAVLVLCGVLVVCGAEAQMDTRSLLHDADKLGLTADQKTKIEAVQKDAQSQAQAILGNSKLSRDERLAKMREIYENERARLKEILTPAQQRKLKDLEYPKRQWSVNGYITAGSDPAHYTVRLDGWPAEYLRYTIRKQGIRLSVLDDTGKAVPGGPRLTLASSVPDVIVPTAEMEGIHAQQVARPEIVLDRESAKPGIYNLQFRAAVDATDGETHEAVKLNDAQASLRFYLTPQPDMEPAFRPGQRFMGTAWEKASASAATPYRDVKSGKPITWGKIATKIATLQRVEPTEGGNRLTFVLEGHTGQICLETDHRVTDLPYLTALLTEPTVRALKAQYEGKQVWCYGGPGGQCVSTEPGMSVGMSGGVDVPLRIRRVERIYMPKGDLAIGNATFIGGERSSAFAVVNPLVVILDAPAKGLEFSGLSYVGDKDGIRMSEDVASNPRAYCLGLWSTVSDRWDFEREYSLTSPFAARPAWPSRMRKAVLGRELTKGMTREMVAWAIGWPAIYGTKSEMLRLDDWAYDNIPFQGHVYFKNGRMVSQYWPSLP